MAASAPPVASRKAVGGGRRATAAFQALFVTFLWSTSWVLIRVGLRDLSLGPLGFAGLRYVLAGLVLLPFAWRALRASPSRPWQDRQLMGQVVLLGLLFYTVTQGAQFVALGLIPAVAVSLVLTTSPIFVALFGTWLLKERLTPLQAFGIAVLIGGALLYFGEVQLGPSAVPGLLVAVVGTLGTAASSLLGRSLARSASDRLGGVVPMTTLSMLVGGVVLLAVGIPTEGFPSIGTPLGWAIILWLAVVNSAMAITLWNHTLKVLTAVESSMLNNTMLAQIAILAWLFLGETVDLRQFAGLVLASLGVLIVQVAPLLHRPRTRSRMPSEVLESPVGASADERSRSSTSG